MAQVLADNDLDLSALLKSAGAPAPMGVAPGTGPLASYLATLGPAKESNPILDAAKPPAPTPKPFVPSGPSGQKLTRTNSDKEMTKAEQTRNVYDPNAFDATQDSSLIKNQQASLDRYNNFLNMAASKPEQNAGWVPGLLSLADAQTGSNLAASYKPSDRLAELLKYSDEGQKRQNDLTKTIIDAHTKSKIGQDQNTQNSTLMNLVTNLATNGSAAGGKTGDILKWGGMVSGDKTVNAANDSIEASKKLNALLEQNTSPAILMSKIQTLRAAGLNRITNFEIGSMGGDRALTERANQALETLQNGDLTKLNVDEIRNAAKVLAQAAPIALKNKRDQYEHLGNIAGISSAEGRKSVLDPIFHHLNEMEAAPPAPNAPSGPAVGTIDGNHRFKGGNPADKNNWEQI